jgi:prepilin-type N-terminal cleavage/methylation domain-containing protein
MNIIKERKGFTLIEILIVVAIIAILASVVLVGLGPTQQAGRDARRISDLGEVQTGLELYYSKCGYYPGAAESAACGAYSETSAWGPLTTALKGSGIGVGTIPNDPSAGKTYYYDSCSGGSSYVLGAQLENVNNSVFVNYNAPTVAGCNTWPPAGETCGTAGFYCLTL